MRGEGAAAAHPERAWSAEQPSCSPESLDLAPGAFQGGLKSEKSDSELRKSLPMFARSPSWFSLLVPELGKA